MATRKIFVLFVMLSLVLSACNISLPVKVDGVQSELVCSVVTAVPEEELMVEVTPVVTDTVVITPMPEVTATPVLPVITEMPQPGPSCQVWAHGETRDLLPGQTALGDVEVAGVIRYDIGGSDEGTVVVNLSSSPISVYAEWGAGCLVVTDLNRLVTNELFNTGCGPSRPCSQVRVVLVTDQGVSETFYTEPLFE